MRKAWLSSEVAGPQETPSDGSCLGRGALRKHQEEECGTGGVLCGDEPRGGSAVGGLCLAARQTLTVCVFRCHPARERTKTRTHARRNTDTHTRSIGQNTRT